MFVKLGTPLTGAHKIISYLEEDDLKFKKTEIRSRKVILKAKRIKIIYNNNASTSRYYWWCSRGIKSTTAATNQKEKCYPFN